MLKPNSAGPSSCARSTVDAMEEHQHGCIRQLATLCRQGVCKIIHSMCIRMHVKDQHHGDSSPPSHPPTHHASMSMLHALPPVADFMTAEAC
jgi:hypothetical protein